jgi:putative ABC transport system substrate-binding protein
MCDWLPLWAHAQPAERGRRIGVLLPYAEIDRESQARIAAFRDAMQRLGWTEGRNVRIEYRWSAPWLHAVEALAPSLDVAVTTVDIRGGARI